MREVAFGIVVSWLGCSALAQTTHVVGPGGFAQIFEATAAAAAGDVILVHPGSYWTFPVERAMTIRAVVPGTVAVSGLFTWIQPSPGDEVHLVGLGFSFVVAVLGRITFDECSFVGYGSPVQAVYADVHFQHCLVQSAPSPTFFNNAAALVADHAHVTATNTTFSGAPMGSAPAGPAIRLISATLQGSHVIVAGGTGAPGAAAIVADSASRLWLSDSTATSDPGTCPIAGGTARVDRCTITPACGSYTSGLVLGLRRLQPPQTGQPFTVEFRAGAGDVVVVLVNWHLDHVVHAQIEQPVFVAASGAWLAGPLVADSSGLATGAWSVPPDPALVDRALWLQGFSGTTLPLQASPVGGGVIR